MKGFFVMVLALIHKCIFSIVELAMIVLLGMQVKRVLMVIRVTMECVRWDVAIKFSVVDPARIH
jgi:hypothetical protein